MKMHTKTSNKLPGLILFSLLISLMVFSHASKAGKMTEPVVTQFKMNKLELSNEKNNPTKWELDIRVMQELQSVVFKTQGEILQGETESENMLLYGQGIAPYWDVQMGLGYDTNDTNSQNWGVIGLSGMAPYFFETNLHGLVDADGHLGVRANTELELLITQRLILVPEMEAEAYSADIPKMNIGAGFSSLALGLRLKYEIKREFAPYIGVQWLKKYGNTANYAAKAENTSLVAGLKFWF